MAGIPQMAATASKKAVCLLCQYASVAYYWKLKLLKTQIQKWKKCGARKQLEKAQSGLGAEVYALSKQGEGDWRSMPLVQQYLKLVEEAEANVFQVDDAIERIENEYLAKKEQIKENCASKRDDLDGDGSAEE